MGQKNQEQKIMEWKDMTNESKFIVICKNILITEKNNVRHTIIKLIK